MIKNWWKILAVGLLLYTLIAGMLIPLKPGIYNVTPQHVQAGTSTQIKVTGYNTHFKEAINTQKVWLKINNDLSIPIDQIESLTERDLVLTFDAPALPTSAGGRINASLVLDNDLDGTMVLPERILYTQDDSSVANTNVWSRLDYDQLGVKEGVHFPFRSGLYETIRNTFFHVALWMAMMVLLMIALYYSIMRLKTNKMVYDLQASSFTVVAILYGGLGIATGSVWAKFTWGTYWTDDIKLNMTAIAWLIYAAYIVLRRSIDDIDRKGRICAVYNIFAFTILIPLIFVVPRLTDSLHPGNGGNPALGGEDLDNTLRMVFYPAIIGLTLLGIWIANIRFRAEKIKDQVLLNIN